MKCAEMSLTGVTLLSAGVIIIGIRQVSYRDDYSNTGAGISGLGVVSAIAGGVMYILSTKPENCEGAGAF
jgi:hypothetical protein